MAYFWAPGIQLNLGPAVAGDLVVGRADGNFDRLARGSNGQILSVVGGLVVWGEGPLTTLGDLLVGATGAAPTRLGIGANGAILNISAGAARWGNVIDTGGLTITAGGLIVTAGGVTIGSALTMQMVSRYIFNGALNISQAANAYLDFGGSFTTTITTLAGDQVRLAVQGHIRKDTAGFAAIVVDRSGTKLPAAGGSSSVIAALEGLAGQYGVSTSFMLEAWDTPAAGTYTYKPQLYGSDANTSFAGRGLNAQYVVEVWR